MKKFLKISVIIFATFSVFHAFADYIGKGSTPTPTSVAEVREKTDGTYVVLEGYIISQLGKDKYEFSDSKNRKEVLCVEIKKHDKGKKIMPDKDFDESQKIRISGEVDKEFKPFGNKCDKIKIDANKVELIP
ncbi:NirD/YgiW/YdeI family stress tolerance protein [Silvanigrella aquatica]|uniref:Uncharacterized protein n=1 Tax=Silvanigrella aquatica TaxID=1915309 RepID=A0A1L4D1P7_9BACT|nr:NirD/YgiW/YdeI family stress tolerance protein [Silvanigrella aquatica]APJ04129.1 hypothetical protein AXG55_09520 [Silvanigrella aquatica]